MRGYKKFAQAQFYGKYPIMLTRLLIDNLTKEQYSGVTKRPSGILSSTRDTLNPLLNTEVLKARLEVIEHYRYEHGIKMAHWPYYAMQRLSGHLMRYKFNYAIKGFAAYLMYRDLARYSHMRSTSFTTIQQDAYMIGTFLFHAGVFTGVCLII